MCSALLVSSRLCSTILPIINKCLVLLDLNIICCYHRLIILSILDMFCKCVAAGSILSPLLSDTVATFWTAEGYQVVFTPTYIFERISLIFFFHSFLQIVLLMRDKEGKLFGHPVIAYLPCEANGAFFYKTVSTFLPENLINLQWSICLTDAKVRLL